MLEEILGMFDKTMFVSEFWEWFIVVPTALGILAMFWLINWMSSDDASSKDGKVETMGHVWDEDLEEYNNPLPMWWLNMFYITLVYGIIYLILYPGMGSFAGVLGWTSTNQYEAEMDAADSRFGPLYDQYKNTPIPELANNLEAVQMGQRLYMNYCTMCHGSNAGGGPGFPNLTDNDWLYGGQPETIQTTIMHGRNGVMPNAQTNGLASDADIENVVEYVLTLSGRPDADAAKAEQGKAHFNRICMACHGMDGKGMQALGAPNLTDNIWLYGASKETITETIKHGRQGKMPAQAEFLGEAKVHLLATYIYSLSHKDEAAAEQSVTAQ